MFKRAFKVIGLSVCILATIVWTQAESGNGSDVADGDSPVRMALKKLEVTDENLELSYDITNDSEHDIWICEDLDISDGFGLEPYELYFAEDGQTIVISRRLDVYKEVFTIVPMTSRYIRLRPGENRGESISHALPIRPAQKYVLGRRRPQGTETANQLVVEIGYYTGDLPGMIRGILEVAEEADWEKFEQIGADEEIVLRYFAGMRIASWYGGLSHFRETNKDLSNEIKMKHAEQLLQGEQVLRITAEGVSIPWDD